MSSARQEIFNPLNPPYQGGLYLPLIRGIEGVAFHSCNIISNSQTSCPLELRIFLTSSGQITPVRSKTSPLTNSIPVQ